LYREFRFRRQSEANGLIDVLFNFKTRIDKLKTELLDLKVPI